MADEIIYTPREHSTSIFELKVKESVTKIIGTRNGSSSNTTTQWTTKFGDSSYLKRNRLTATHHHVIEIVSRLLNIEPSILEEGILKKEEYIQTFDSFFIRGGKEAIVICFQPASPSFFELEKWDSKYSHDRPQILSITNNFVDSAHGKCVVIYRLRSNVDFEVKHLLDETCYAYAEIDPLSGTFTKITEFISRLNDPAKENKEWTDLLNKISDPHLKYSSLTNISDDFRIFSKLQIFQMEGVRLDDAVLFEMDWDFYEKHLSTTEEIENSCTNLDIIKQAESIVKSWKNIIERAVVENQQLRRENEEVGPAEEMIYWQRMLSKFSSIMEHIQSFNVRAFIDLLTQLEWKIIEKWKSLEDYVIGVKIMAEDNVKYLKILEKFYEPLYRLNPTQIVEHLPHLMYGIRTIYSTSRFLNTRQMITPIVVKITNQLIIQCKAYLTQDGNLNIWKDSKAAMIIRIKDCIKLCDSYYDCYKLVRGRIQDISEGQFFQVSSEILVFRKFHNFKTRITKIMNILETTLTYSILHSSSIEGIDTFAQKFSNFFRKITLKKYDSLNHRKSYFDNDYEEFKKQVAETEIELWKFSTNLIAKATNISNALTVLARFEKLNLKCLKIDRSYLELVPNFKKEIDQIRDKYNEDRSNPSQSHQVPPITSRIKWIRKLYRHIEMPIDKFKLHPRVINHDYMQYCIKKYNALITVFVNYEMIYHKAWYDSAETVRLALLSPLLVRNPHTNIYHINFHPYIKEVILESENMLRFGLEVPKFIKVLTITGNKIFSSYNVIQNLVNENNALRRSIPPVFINLMKLIFIKIEKAFQPCLSDINWISLGTGVFDEIRQVLNEVKTFVDDIMGLKRTYIDEPIDEISHIELINLSNCPLPADELLQINLNVVNDQKEILQSVSSAAEKTGIDIINRLIQFIDDPNGKNIDWMDREKAQRQIGSFTKLVKGPFELGFEDIAKSPGISANQIKIYCIDLFAYFNTKLIDALVKCTRISLDLLKSYADTKSIFRDEIIEEEEAMNPIMTTDYVLQIPNIEVVPSVEELNSHYLQIISNILETHKSLTMWGSRNSSSLQQRKELQMFDDDTFKNYYNTIAENKEIVRCKMRLQGLVIMLKNDITSLGDSYLRYAYLWDAERENLIESFINSEPTSDLINDKFMEYENLFLEIAQLPDHHTIGCIEIRMAKLKQAFIDQVAIWKQLLGDSLKKVYTEKLNVLTDYIATSRKTMEQSINNLEDVRIAMKCLNLIREDFIALDLELILIQEVYELLHRFNIEVLQEDQFLVDRLEDNFIDMLYEAQRVQMVICEMQAPLKQELIMGVNKLRKDVDKFHDEFEHSGPMVVGIPAAEACERLTVYQGRFEELWNRYETYNSGEALFGIEPTEYPALHQRKKEINLLQKLYSLYSQVMEAIDGYFKIPWSAIDIEAIGAELADLQNKCRRLPKGMKDWPAFIDLKKKIDDFNATIPLLELMANKSMLSRHWERMSKLCNYNFDVESKTFTLAHVLEAPLLKYKDDVEDICISSVKEKDIESKLNQVIADWSIVDLQFTQFKQRGELQLKGSETNEIISQLEDSLMVMSSLMANRYNAPYKKQIQLWQHKLSNTSEVLAKWLTVQNLWAYLEAVFIGGDIAKQLPQEANRFNTIDAMWVELMEKAHRTLNAVETCAGDETMGELLTSALEQLEFCQKSLSGYLESKRVIFPRFCFISDPTLLEILGQASDCHTIQNYLDGFFDNMDKLDFSERDYNKIIVMYSRENERIVLEKEVSCIGGVEHWLNNLLIVHQQSVGGVISQGLQILDQGEKTLLELIDNSVLQVGLLALQVLWTVESEVALNTAKRDKTIMRKTNQYFLDLLNSLIEVTVTDLTKYMRAKYEALITIHVHQRDIFDELFRLRIRNTYDFEWLKQCRFYYDSDTENVTARITDIDFVYQNEFLGCTDRLAITPLTDRCYITLSQAVGMNFGGAPAGPAGTGKTETTKDMGKALGKYVVVFNCSDQMDFRGLGRIFKGLAQAGIWGCFDEFNRIDLPVLSVAAQQIAILFYARKERASTFLFSDGDTYKMNPEFGIFITMNPGYAGRQELPENLKIQFRSVAMMVPDRQIIMRVKLAACGFKENVLLSRKFFVLYKLCEEQLSKQVHYDFGLRNILSCLRTLGAQKRAHPNDSEETTLMRVLRDMNLSKLVDEDEPLFMSLIEDMFPSIKLSVQSYKDLQRGIENATIEMGIMNHPEWNLKAVQLYETSLVRHGLMVLGPTGAGKTRCMWALMKALTEMGIPHKEVRMNPKAITASQMFGKLDVTTNDWTDGIFSTLWRRSTQIKKTENLWIVLDGPVDAVWIENLNSVLDDNKTLTLANGDRITMAPNSKLVFEPDNVDNASPATVSRMGMVFVSASVLKWNHILDGWLKTRSHHESELLRRLFHKIYGAAHTFVQTRLQAKMVLLESIYIRQCIDILEGLLIDATKLARALSDEHIEKFFLFSMMWSLGAVLELNGRSALQEFVLADKSKCDWPKCTETTTIFEYLVSGEGEWIHWTERVPKFEYPKDRVLSYYSLLVPNVDNTRMLFLIDIIAKQEKSVLLIGEQGTAKTVMIKSYMSKFDPDYHLNKSFNFSSASTPNMVQRIFESYVEKRVGTTFGPPGGRKMTIFIDDINMPVINEWGDQVTNEIVRQLMEYKGFYSIDKPGDFCTMQDLMLLAAMIHPGGGRNDIPPRLKRQFNIFNCTLPSENSMDTIFSTIGEGYFCDTRFPEHIVEFLPKLIPMTRVLWQRTKIKMLPTPAKFHYVFNLRDLSRIWEGILRIERNECQSITTLLKLWEHECTRVIADRFITETDTEWFINSLRATAEELLGPNFVHYKPVETYFVNFLREPPEPTGDEPEDFVIETPKIYEEIPSYEVVIKKIVQNMDQFNEFIRGIRLDLVFFHDALVHLIRVSRIIGVPRGSVLFVGIGGSGKQSLTRLASFIAGFDFFQIVLSRIYNVASLMDDLRKIYRAAGVGPKGQTFIFTDNEIKDEAFLEYINNILSVGEIANLFPKDELDEILSTAVPLMKKEDPKRPPTQDNLYDFFITRARDNLHMALCFSPVGEKFRSRSLKFPGLISGCTINWFSKWPKDALCAVSAHFLQTFQITCTTEVKKQLIDVMGDVQDDINDISTEYYNRFRRQTYVTPKSFLTFINDYKILYAARLENIQMLSSRMSNGLSKLVDAAVQVDQLRKELASTQKEITVKNVEVEAIVITVNEKKKEAETVKAQVQVSKNQAETILKVIKKEKAVAEKKLKAAEPALMEAEAALLTIKAADISTVRKLGKPPYLITLIMDCVLILFGKRLEPVKPDLEKQFLTPAWGEALKIMADTRFLYNLQNFPKDNINGETVDLMIPYLKYPLYTYEAAKQACGNVAGLIQWTIAMVSFYEINKDVLPLKANLVIQEGKLDKATGNLAAAEDLLKAKDRDLKKVQEEFDGVMSERQKIVDLADTCQNKMDTATAMIDGLSGERIRWTNQIASFKSEIERLIGDILILTGFLSYCGPFNQEFRTILMQRWSEFVQARRIPISSGINIVNSLIDTATIGEWNLQGLPSDELSIQNGIIATKASRYPLLIDPQLQGKGWIKKKESEHNLRVTTLADKYFRNHLEDCVSFGYPLLIEDVAEELDPVLDNLLEKNFMKIGTSLKVKLGDKEVDYSGDFRLYITTKLPNPSYTPEIFARTAIVDFTVTMRGLEDQLLGRVILIEKRELETEKNQLIADVTANKRKITELESNLLHKLTTVQGPLIEDVELMSVLNNTKQTAAEVNENLSIARETELKIDTAREEFRPVATRGSVLYFLICDMAQVNMMYQTSLTQFLERFDISLERSEKSPVNHKRINNIIEYLTYEVYKYKARGLYEIHKFMFLLLMTLKIDLQRGNINHDEFQYFIKGGAALNLNAVAPKTCKWIADVTWLNLVALSSLRNFQYIVEQVPASEKLWKQWFDKEAPEEESIPDNYDLLDTFRRLLLIRAWCIDRTLSQSREYIASSLGSRYAEPVITLMDVMYNESRPDTPMVGFLNMGSDPTPAIEQYAKKSEIRCKSISMGQGQETHARKLLNAAKDEGFWALFQNCHLGLEYMLEVVIFMSEMEAPHPNFRLWITTEPHNDFPVSLLQMSIKYTYEPPQGIRAGLMATYSGMNQEILDQCDAPQYIPLIYTVSFLHTVVQERRKFGPLGWNIPYEFNSADWIACCMFMNNYFGDYNPKQGISWQTIRYMVGEVQYGGRVTDDYDKRLLNTFARVWFADAVFNPEFNFYQGYPVFGYKIVSEYLKTIDAMPSVDPPQAYGLHSNANITYQSNTTQTVLDTIISVQPKEAGATGSESREELVVRLAREMLDKLPPAYDPFQVRTRLQIMGITTSMNIFLKQEIDRIQVIIKLVRNILKDLLLAIEGVIIMSEQLRDALDNIYDARVPGIWKARSWESSSLGFWFTELIERNQQFSDWLLMGRPNKFWMTGFFNPQGFLTAMRQEVTRAHKGWTLDNVTIHNEVLRFNADEIRASPAEGVYVHGLILEGAGWNKRQIRLVESKNKILYVMMPVIHIYALSNASDKDPKLYLCPVYKKPQRTNLMFITPLWLQTERPPEFWVLRGVALLCNNK